jgi:nicotinate phosphoribosyltransferase
VTIPGRKNLYRIYGQDGKALCDILTKSDEPPPKAGVKLLSRHPFSDQRRAYVTPTSVQSLYKLYWTEGEVTEVLPSLKEIREYVILIQHRIKYHLQMDYLNLCMIFG